jgi:phenylpyruvate tautomerase PptA (4-oxalocrotonate tautomerase family)
MPFTRISLLKGKSPEYRKAISDGFHRALVEMFNVPPADRFQVIEQLEPGQLIFDRDYLGGPRSDDFVLFNVTAGKPRTVATKRAFYKRLVALLAEAPGMRPQDVMVIITMTTPDEWSFSGGEPWEIKAA